MRQQLGLSYLNGQGKVDLGDNKWQQLVSLMKSAAKAQENNEQMLATPATFPDFYKNKNIAIYVGNLGPLIGQAPILDGDLNWDMVTFPRIAGEELTVPGVTGYFAIPAQSKNKEYAFELIRNRIEDLEFNEQRYGNSAMMNKNMAAIENIPVATNIPGEFDVHLTQILDNSLRQMVKEDKDVNTTIREMQEAMQKQVDNLGQQ